ncbi:hypothetical protein Pmar_PMAR027425, partial [Perkinsus marinus ATCC 50983]
RGATSAFVSFTSLTGSSKLRTSDLPTFSIPGPSTLFNRKYTYWTTSEIDHLEAGVRKYGLNWTHVSRKCFSNSIYQRPSRSGQQCRDKFRALYAS